MASVQYYAAASLDGYIARPDGSIDWLQEYGADAELDTGPMQDGGYDAFYAEVGALVMGSGTYEWVLENARAWPYDVPAWVFTSRELRTMDGADITFASGDHAEVRAAALERAGGKNVWLVGGGVLASAWTDARLIDELIVTSVPVWLGEGIPLFGRAVEGELRLQGSTPHGNGMVELRYRMPD